MLGAVESEHLFVAVVLLVSSLLNVAYLLPIVARGFFLPPKDAKDGKGKIEEAPIACLVPLCITAALCVVLFFAVAPLESILGELVATGEAGIDAPEAVPETSGGGELPVEVEEAE